MYVVIILFVFYLCIYLLSSFLAYHLLIYHYMLCDCCQWFVSGSGIGDHVVVTMLLSPYHCDHVIVTKLLWPCCCDNVVTLLLWPCYCDNVVVTMLLSPCCCDVCSSWLRPVCVTPTQPTPRVRRRCATSVAARPGQTARTRATSLWSGHVSSLPGKQSLSGTVARINHRNPAMAGQERQSPPENCDLWCLIPTVLKTC